MPVYTITDTKTGQTKDVRLAAPPSQEEAERFFSQPHPEAKIGAEVHPFGQPNISLSPESVDVAGMRKSVSPGVEQFMREPLMRPTGIETVDSFLSPASLAMMGPSAASAIKGGLSGLSGNIGSPLVQKVLKLITPSALKKPSEIVDLLAELNKVLKSGGGAAEPVPTPASSPAPSAPPAEPVASAPVARARRAAAKKPVATQSPSAESTPNPTGQNVDVGPDGLLVRRPGGNPNDLLVGRPGGNPDLPDVRASSEAAMARRRAQVNQAESRVTPSEPPSIRGLHERKEAEVRSGALGAASTPPTPTPNLKLNAAETRAFLDLLQRGMSGPEAMKNVLLQRELVGQLGTPTPTGKQTRFPKGMRGKSRPPE